MSSDFNAVFTHVIGPRGASQLLIRSTQRASNLQSGTVFNYVLIMVVLLLYLYWGFSSGGRVWALQVWGGWFESSRLHRAYKSRVIKI